MRGSSGSAAAGQQRRGRGACRPAPDRNPAFGHDQRGKGRESGFDMAGGEMQDATPLRCDHHCYGGQGGDQRTRENQNTHHDHHDVSLLPYVAIRHINRTVTIDFSVQFRR